MAQLDLRTRAGMLKGGVNGPAVVPGDSAQSRLYQQVAGMVGPIMPMGGSLTEEERLLLRDWIDQGAKWDSGVSETAELSPPHDTPIRSSGQITSADREWWAFQKIKNPPVPLVSNARAAQNPIDAFIFRQFEEKGIEPAPRANRSTLIRRAYLDLVGLLPTPAQVDAFVNDSSPDAFAKVVDELLASPHYGERWGRHWLDVVRYSDSGGYEQDYDYPNAWRYRDYVIAAFNKDKPYDQFIREQLAGDELENPTFESLIATGYYVVGPRVQFREKDNPQYRYAYLDDMIGTTSRGFMGLSVNCARCHDHKFDPIKQVDYYRMMAVLFPHVKYDYPLASPEEVAAYEKKKAEVEARLAPLKEAISEIEAPYREKAFRKAMEAFPEDIQLAVNTPEEKRTEGQKLLAKQVAGIGGGDYKKLLTAEDTAAIKALQANIKKVEQGMPEELPMATGVRDGDYRFAPDGRGDDPLPGKGNRIKYDFEGSFVPEAGKPYDPPQAHLLPSGDYLSPGPPVEPGYLQVLWNGDTPTALPPHNGHITTGRRRAFAEWLVSGTHPLTARVMANRIWHFHFGRGIVSTPSNFGRMGELPTHPELLDWLASEFRANGWSIKHMHRLIMNSETYQMASSFDHAQNRAADPQNKLLWRFPLRRLEAEGLRDIILDAGGTLNLKAGGKPFFPPVPESVWKASFKGTWEITKEGPENWRRSIYSYWKRGLRYPLFEVFDQPDPNVTCERRNTTTVPTQALTLLNNEFVLLQAQHFAQRVRDQAGPDPAAQVRSLYRIALSREPSPQDIEGNLAFLEKQAAYHRSHGKDGDAPALAALTDLCDVMLNTNEFVYIN
jgi:Protein of unknown function (DUF1553)/Protein of unknown function (DUF1549)/Planctomycete cytochrome C